MIGSSPISAASISAAGVDVVYETILGSISLPVEVSVVIPGSASVGLDVSVVDPHVFDFDGRLVEWFSVVRIAGADISNRLVGQTSISAAEESARVATFTFIVNDAAELDMLDSAAVTIDLCLIKGGVAAGIWRRFTGVIERREDFNLSDNSITVHCRDGYQERIKACSSAAEVEALLGGQATVCESIVSWSSDNPNPAGYFSGLLATLPGSVAIDSSGFFRVIPWSFSVPDITFGPDDIFDEPVGEWPDRADVPAAIEAKLTVRINRLHSVAVTANWSGLSYYRLALDGCNWPTKALVNDALSGLSNWYVRGAVSFGMMTPGAYPVVAAGGGESYFTVDYSTWQSACNSFSAQLYTRWYQEVDVVYSALIELGGASDRDTSISDSMVSNWDAGAWESSSSGNDSNLYAANAPAGTSAVGYGALLPPYPPDNGAVDYYPDIGVGGIDAGIQHVAAKAIRLAASGFRDRSITIEKLADPRWEIGAVFAIVTDRISALGQLVSIKETHDHDSGEIVSVFKVACPQGAGSALSFSASVAVPSNDIAHEYPAPLLGNHIGASQETPYFPDEATLDGMLTNVLPTGIKYQADKPVYVPQFRITMPEIYAVHRDPTTVNLPISLAAQFPAGNLTYSF